GPVATVAATLVVVAGAAVAVGATRALAAISPGHARLDHRLELALDGKQRQQIGIVLLATGDDGQDREALELLVDLDLEFVSDLGVGRQNRTVEGSLRLTGAGRAPRPGAVALRARQFDVDPSRHGQQPYRLR